MVDCFRPIGLSLPGSARFLPVATLLLLLLLGGAIPVAGQQADTVSNLQTVPDAYPGGEVIAEQAGPETTEADAASRDLTLESPGLVLIGAPFSVSVGGVIVPADTVAFQVRVGERLYDLSYDPVEHSLAAAGLTLGSSGMSDIELVRNGEAVAQTRTRAIPGWLSILPPLLAILLALVFREVVISLFSGVWLGALIYAGFNPIEGTMRAIDRYIVNAISDPYHVAVIVFSLLLGGMVGVVSRSGGARGVVEVLLPYATTRKRGQLIAWVSGLLIFFDDYANTLIRGNALRPLTDQLLISREKLAYIVDSVAAPIVVIAIISTWVGFEISMIASSLDIAARQATDPELAAQLAAGSANAFLVFIHSIPYLFYPFLAIGLVLMIIVSGREFGPMREAELRTIRGGGVFRPGAMLAADTENSGLEPAEETPKRWYNLVVPVFVVINVAFIGLYYTGWQELEEGERSLRNIIGSADPFASLLWASFAGVVVAIALAVGQSILTMVQAIDAWVAGMRSMLLAMVILVLAWSLSGITEELGTGIFLSQALESTLPLSLLPTVVFIIAAVTAFATGTAWGTMAILFPVVVPLAAAMGAGIGFEGGDDYTPLLGAISSIMAGAVFGDHASPISDTTVISSMGSGCDHIDHVRTQLPYALLAASVAIVFGTLPAGFGVHPVILLPAGMLVMYLIMRFLGRPIESNEVG
jgi:Na+/H+ antiporter NhaC